MEYRVLGRTGVSVTQLCLGAMMFGAFGNSDEDDCVRIIHKALDAGINFIDTADGYSAGGSETILGKALGGGRRDRVVLAVKFGVAFDSDDPNRAGASRRWIIDAVEGSLRRLQTDYIDLYQVGVPDHATDIDETLGALSDLVRAGKVRYIGASKVPASQIVEAQSVSERRGHERFRSEQPPYSILTRAIEYDLLPTCQRHGLGVLAYSPLAGGWLSGRYTIDGASSGPGSRARQARFGPRFDATNPANARQARGDACVSRLGAGGRADSDPAGGRVRSPPPGGHVDDHRSTDDGPPRRLPSRRWCSVVGRDPRPHRPDRGPGCDHQRRGQHVELRDRGTRQFAAPTLNEKRELQRTRTWTSRSPQARP